jgi:hypothetical protein
MDGAPAGRLIVWLVGLYEGPKLVSIKKTKRVRVHLISFGTHLGDGLPLLHPRIRLLGFLACYNTFSCLKGVDR